MDLYNKCIDEKYRKKIDKIYESYYICDSNDKKLKCGILLINELKILKNIIKEIKYENINRKNIIYYRKLFLLLDDIKLLYRFYKNRSVEILNDCIDICENKGGKKLEKYKRNIKYKPRFKHAQNIEEKKTLNILYKKLNNKKNSIIHPNMTMDVKYKRKLRADFYVYIDYFKKIELLVEYDGESHYNKDYIYYTDKNVVRDKIKDKYCIENNINVIRYNNHKLLEKNIDKIIESIMKDKIIYYCDYREEYMIDGVNCWENRDIE